MWCESRKNRKAPLVLAILVLFGLIVDVAYGATWVVDNQMHRAADFRSIQAAHDSERVKDGDTLLIRPSPESYLTSGGAVISKRLNLVGNGYLQSENRIESPEGDDRVVLYNTLTISSVGGEEGAGISHSGRGTVLSGLETAWLKVLVEDVLVERCWIRNTIFFDVKLSESDGRALSNYHGLIVANCLVEGQFRFERRGGRIRIENSILRTRPLWFSNLEYATIRHCLFIGVSDSNTFGFDDHCVVENCVFTTNFGHLPAGSRGNVYVYPSDWTGTYVPDLSENSLVPAKQSDTVFVGGDSPDAQWQLAEDSPARGLGVGGVDPGPFGGLNPYVISGLPRIPLIERLSLPAVVSGQSGLPVRVRIRAVQ